MIASFTVLSVGKARSRSAQMPIRVMGTALCRYPGANTSGLRYCTKKKIREGIQTYLFMVGMTPLFVQPPSALLSI